MERTCTGDRVVVELFPASCPHCPYCFGEGGRWIGTGPHGEDPEFWVCDECWRPLVTLRYPGWLDRTLPGSLLRRADRCADTDPPF
jgi:hypothetical protein